MKAIVLDKEIKIVEDYKKPIPKQNEALVKVSLAGLCNTDIELTKGYMNFKGILGHEFVGIIEELNSDDKSLLGKRVTGEINFACNNCEYCKQSLQRHCPNRTVLGILNRDGCFAEYATVPVENIKVIPKNVTDEEAVFIEPLAAAFEILEQVQISKNDKIAILGDGKLGLLIALTLNTINKNITLVGKHKNKLDIAKEQGLNTILLKDFNIKKDYDIVVEATGSSSGFEIALNLTKPRGKLILKSTVADGKPLNLAPVVIDEISIIGSRCGLYEPAIKALKEKQINVKPLITKVFDLTEAKDAFEYIKNKDTVKVLLKP